MGKISPGGGGGGAARGKKPEKIRLTKQQKVRVAQMIRIENRISVCREYIQVWSRFFQFFADDIQSREIKPQEEKAFFQTVTMLARKHFLFTELMGETFEYADKVLDVLISASSLSSIKSLDEATLGKLELDWHTLFLDMNVTLGRLLRLMPAKGPMGLNERLARAEAAVKGTRPPPSNGAGGTDVKKGKKEKKVKKEKKEKRSLTKKAKA